MGIKPDAHDQIHAFCKVCGYDPGYPPWGLDGDQPTNDICNCCGVEWGYEDTAPSSIINFRERWIAEGAPWDDPEIPDDGLTTGERLANIRVSI